MPATARIQTGQTFADLLRSLGIRHGAIKADGQWHRCPTDDKPASDNGRYKLTPDGLFGLAQDWATMPAPVKWFAGATTAADFDWEEHNKATAKAKAEEARRHAQASQTARDYWARCKPLRGGHPYLKAKGLDMDGCGDLRVAADGWLVVPAFIGEELVSLQRISPEGVKRQWPGATMKGSSCRITRKGSTLTAVVEGLATGLAVYQAMGRASVIVGWCTGMLALVGPLPAGYRVVCADNDHGTAERIGHNPGVEHGRAAADALRAGVVWPEGIIGTDWADWRLEKRHAALVQERRAGTAYRVVDEEMSRLITSKALWVPA